MDSFVAPEYEEIEKSIFSSLEEYDLDTITVKSLIRGSIEVLEDEMPRASIVVLDEKNLKSGVSVKVRNIKVNFRFAIDSIFALKPVFDLKEIGLVLAILKAILFLLEKMEIPLDANEAMVVFCLYRLQKATPEKIVEYSKGIGENKGQNEIEVQEIGQSLKKLEDIGTVKLENEEYRLCETIVIDRAVKKA